MVTATQVPLDTYLNTVYDPDVDYVDGKLEDRNVGHYDHSIVQQQILMWLYLTANSAWGGQSSGSRRKRLFPLHPLSNRFLRGRN
jgi:hypothetical protein